MVDGSVLLLSQHHQGDDNHGCYNDASNHQADDSTLVGAHILSKEDLWEGKGHKIVYSGCHHSRREQTVVIYRVEFKKVSPTGIKFPLVMKVT